MFKYALSAYTLAAKFQEVLIKFLAMDKKDRGLGRAFSRFLSEVARPSVVGGQTIDFTFELAHANLGGKLLEDWYARVIALCPALKDPEVFAYCTLDVAREEIFSQIEHYHGDEKTRWLCDLLLLRFEQVLDPMPHVIGNPHKVMPVVSVLVPADAESWSATKKLQYLDMLSRLAESYMPRATSGNLVNSWHNWDRRSVKAELPAYPMHMQLTRRQVPLTATFVPVANEIMAIAESHEGWMQESSTWVSTHSATYRGEGAKHEFAPAL